MGHPSCAPSFFGALRTRSWGHVGGSLLALGFAGDEGAPKGSLLGFTTNSR